MAYTPPAGDAVQFNFTESGYVAPAGDSVAFNFADATPQNVLRLGAYWTTDASDGRISFSTRWATEAEGGGRLDLGARWQTLGADVDTSLLGTQWLTEVGPFLDLLLGAQWATTGASAAVQLLGAQWDTAVGREIAILGAQWITGASQPVDTLLGSAWDTAGAPSDILLSGSQWETVGVPSQVIDIAAEWQTLGVSDVVAIFGAQFEVVAPMIDTLTLEVTWSDLQYVEQEFIIAYNDEVGQTFELYARIGLDDVEQEFVLDSRGLTSVEQQFVLTSALGDVEQSFELPSAILSTVAQAFDLPSPILSAVEQAFALDSEIKMTTTVERAFELLSPILGDSQVFTRSQQTLTINGETVALASVEISMEEGQFAWTCEAELLDPRQYALFHADDQFTVALGADVYTFVVESKRMARGGVAQIEASISGISPSAQYANPRAKRVTKTWSTAVLATAVAAELFPGETIDWRILDWSIPARRLAADNEAPIEILLRVAAAAGAVVETNPDGTLYVRYAYPVPVADYLTMTPDQTYTDVTDRFSMSEAFAAGETVNRIRILDVTPGAYADVIEFEQDRMNPATGKLRVYPSPWRETFSLEHTSLPIVSIERLGADTAEHTETVEVLRGEGSVQYPIDAVLAIEWLYADLGGITFEADQREFHSTSTTQGESLVRITYRTRFIDYRAVAFVGAEVQFVVYEPELV